MFTYLRNIYRIYRRHTKTKYIQNIYAQTLHILKKVFIVIFQELVKYSKRLGDDCTDLQKALELFLGVPSRATNNLFIASIEGYRGNIYKLGRLLTHDWFTVDFDGDPQNRYIFLFKARILVCEVQKVADDRSVFILTHIIKVNIILFDDKSCLYIF